MLKNLAIISVLKIPSFRNLWLAQLISQVFLNLLLFSLIIQVYNLTRSNSSVAWLVLLVTLPNVFLGAIAGVLVDRFGRKTVMFLSHFLRIFIVLAFLLSAETVSWIYFLAFSASLITQFFFPAEAGTIYELVEDPKLLLTANSLFTVTFFGSVILGNVLAGPALQTFGPSGTFLFVATAFFVASLFTAKLPGKLFSKIQNQTKVTIGVLMSDLMVGLDHIYRNPDIQKAMLAMGASQISIGIIGAIAPGFADRVLGVSASSVSLLVMAPAALGMAVGALCVGQFFRKAKRENLIRVGFLVASLTLAIYGYIGHWTIFFHLPIIPISLLILTILGASNAFLDVPVNTLIQENTPDKIRSRVYGVVSSVIGLAGVFPIFLSGALADILGVSAVMSLTGVTLFIIGYFTYRTKNSYANSI